MEDLPKPFKDVSRESGIASPKIQDDPSAEEESVPEAIKGTLENTAPRPIEKNTVNDQNSEGKLSSNSEQVNKRTDNVKRDNVIESNSCPATGSEHEPPDHKDCEGSTKEIVEAENNSLSSSTIREDNNIEASEGIDVTQGAENCDTTADVLQEENKNSPMVVEEATDIGEGAEGTEKLDAAADVLLEENTDLPMVVDEIAGKGKAIGESEGKEVLPENETQRQNSTLVQEDISEGQSVHSPMEGDDVVNNDSEDHGGSNEGLCKDENKQECANNLQDESVSLKATQEDADKNSRRREEIRVEECNATKESYKNTNSISHPESADGTDDSNMDVDEQVENTHSPATNAQEMMEFVHVDSKVKETLEEESNGLQDEDSEDASNVEEQDPIGISNEANEESRDQMKMTDSSNIEQDPTEASTEANEEASDEIKVSDSFSITSETNGAMESKDPLEGQDEIESGSNNDTTNIAEDRASEKGKEAETNKDISNVDENDLSVSNSVDATNDESTESNMDSEKYVDVSEKDDSESSKDVSDTTKEPEVLGNESGTNEKVSNTTSSSGVSSIAIATDGETEKEENDKGKDNNDSMEIEEITMTDEFQTVEKENESEGQENALEKTRSSEGKKDDPLDQAVAESNPERPSVVTETITGDKVSEVVDEGDEGICIIPDTVPRIKRLESEQHRGKSSAKDAKGSEERLSEKCVSSSGKDAKGKGESPKGRKKSLGEVMDRIREKSVEQQTEGGERRGASRPQRQAAKKAESQIKELAAEDAKSQESQETTASAEKEGSLETCSYCFRLRPCKFQVLGTGRLKYLCSEDCYNSYQKDTSAERSDSNSTGTIHLDSEGGFTRKCVQCTAPVTGEERNLSWETMDYCNEDCLGKFQRVLGSHCANCKGSVAQHSLGKYCVRFGYDVKQFCCSGCLEEFKKGLKVCSYCQKDISAGSDGFLAPVGDKGQFKDFCTQSCMEKYDQMSNQQAPPAVIHNCAVCNNEKVVKLEVIHNKAVNKLCSEPCFAAFKFVNGVVADQCFMCKKYFDKREVENFSVYSDESVHSFCNKTCMNVYILANRKIVPCQWCKVKKYNFDMIKRVLVSGQTLLVCSLNCLTLYQVSISAISSKRVKCDMCGIVAQPQYHLTMSDATIRNFCNYQCVMQFQGQYAKSSPVPTESTPVPTGAPKRSITRSTPSSNQNENQVGAKINSSGAMPIISSVTSLAPSNQSPTSKSTSITTRSAALKPINNVPQNQSKSAMMYKQQVVFRPPPPKAMKHKSTSCRPCGYTKGVSCRPHVLNKETQTNDLPGKPVLIPVPVPIFVPAPMHMYTTPFPVPVPFPLPVPVPLFIPTTRKSAAGIMKEIKRIQDKIPTDPFEAELLMMAEMVAGEKKAENSDSDSDDGDNIAGDIPDEPAEAAAATAVVTAAPASVEAEGGFSPEAVDSSNTFGDDMLQMALKMATELEEPTDLEAALTTSTITPQPAARPPAREQSENAESEDDPEPVSAPESRSAAPRVRKRAARPTRSSTASKRRRGSGSGASTPVLPPAETPPARTRTPEQEKPDANMCLKYTFGVNAWKQWVLAKNAELEKAASSSRKLKLFKPEILQLTADELNYSLCLFVKEVRKPNGSEYAPDTIYYLCLGIQQYLFENGRIDNIFTDPYYEKFTECLNDIAKKFSALYNDAQFIVTRVEEEHLWESKQLGAHSPHVLLSTLMFFNTKHFNLTTVAEHMQLSFSHIMKHWKRYPNQPANKPPPGGPRNVLLRFYPPPHALEAGKRKLYEQQENEENPLRCPVKLYEFYLSKCPESVKARNDVFYLLPERSCVPDSPVWYSTMALGKDALLKMLHRVKMVKEINVALLAT